MKVCRFGIGISTGSPFLGFVFCVRGLSAIVFCGMLRGAGIDLETSRTALQGLPEVYVHDLEAREISDPAIAAVNTIVRCLEGALGKVANEVRRQFGSREAQTYFPMTHDPSCFAALLDHNIPGLASNHPKIAEAFERNQPYQPGKQVLGMLKALYRENHHHDFTAQERRDTQSADLVIDGGIAISLGSHGVTIGGPPPWRGIPLKQRTTHTTEESPLSVEFREITYIDWYFKTPNVSVLGTLIPLDYLSRQACEDVCATAGL
jgi:hypothetical protein